MVARRQSKIRQAIYEAVVTHPVHPTAEYVYEYLKPQHPSLSLGTVYRNLGILAEQGLVRKLSPKAQLTALTAIWTHIPIFNAGSAAGWKMFFFLMISKWM